MRRALTPIAEHIFALSDDVRLFFADDQIQLTWRDQPRYQIFTKLTSKPA